MDIEVATWLAGLIQEAVTSIEHRSGLTIEVDDDAANWVQVIPESDEMGQPTGFMLNLPFREAEGDPEQHIAGANINLPPGSAVASWERHSHITLHLRPDIPLVALALLIGDLLTKFGHAKPDYEINVQILHGL